MAKRTDKTNPYMGKIDTRATLLAGVLGGIAFLIVQLALTPLAGLGVWEPIRMIGAVLLGAQALAPPATFDIGIFLTAMVVHFGLSIIYAFVLAAIIRDQSQVVSVGLGLAFGLLLYGINLYLFTGLYPWFAEARNWVTVLSHLVYGGLTGWIYVRVTVGAQTPRIAGEQRA